MTFEWSDLQKMGLKFCNEKKVSYYVKKIWKVFFVFEYIKLSYTIVELWMIVPLQKRGYNSLYVYAFMG